MKIRQVGDIQCSRHDYLIPVTIKVLFHKLRTTRLLVTGHESSTNVIAEDGKFVNREARNWAVSLVNQIVMERFIRRQVWDK